MKHFRPFPALLLSLLSFLGGFPPARADVPDTRHGTVIEYWQQLGLEGGLTLVAQHAAPGDLDNGFTASADLVLTFPMGKGIWTVYVEGSTTPGTGRIPAELPEVNADAGTALDHRGRGRIQLSELHYTHPLGGGSLVAGLIDPAGFLDASEVANDETAQFLGSDFVNNPSIELPDDHLGLAWHLDAGAHPGITLLLGSSHGLADVGGRYTDLVYLNDTGKGLFAAMEVYGPTGSGLWWRAGLWTRTDDHERQDRHGSSGPTHGAWVTVDGHTGRTRWNLRLGWATPDTRAEHRFAALALDHPLGGGTLGLGVAWTDASPDLAGGADRLHAEGYWQVALSSRLDLTLDVQWLRHAGLAANREALWVAGVRLSARF